MPALPPTGDSEGDEERQNTLENLLTRTESLAEHLSWQLRFSDLTEEEKQIASLIIGNLDVDGYLQASTKEIAASAGVSVELVERVLQIIQACDPPGVGARDLRECLLLQLRAQGLDDPTVEDPTLVLAGAIVQDHLPVLEGRRFERLSKERAWIEKMGLKVDDPRSFDETAAKMLRNQLLIFSRWCQVMLRGGRVPGHPQRRGLTAAEGKRVLSSVPVRGGGGQRVRPGEDSGRRLAHQKYPSTPADAAAGGAEPGQVPTGFPHPWGLTDAAAGPTRCGRGRRYP